MCKPNSMSKCRPNKTSVKGVDYVLTPIFSYPKPPNIRASAFFYFALLAEGLIDLRLCNCDSRTQPLNFCLQKFTRAVSRSVPQPSSKVALWSDSLTVTTISYLCASGCKSVLQHMNTMPEAPDTCTVPSGNFFRWGASRSNPASVRSDLSCFRSSKGSSMLFNFIEQS